MDYWFLATIILGLGTTYYFVAYLMTNSKLKKLETEKRKWPQKAVEEAQGIVEEAKREAERVAEEAELKARKILEGAKSYDEDKAKSLSSFVSQEVTDIGEAMTKEMEEEVTLMRQKLVAQQEKARRQLDEYVTSEMKKAKVEIDSTRDKQLDIAKEEVKKLVSEVSQQVLGKVISAEESDELIIKALNNAKQSGLF